MIDTLTLLVLIGAVGGLFTVLTLPPLERSVPWSSQPLALRGFVTVALIGAAGLAIYLAAVGRWVLCDLRELVNRRRHLDARRRAQG